LFIRLFRDGQRNIVAAQTRGTSADQHRRPLNGEGLWRNMSDRRPADGENDPRGELPWGAAEAFFRRLSSDLADVAVPVAVVVAHPDDETIGCGAILRRLPLVRVVHVTDGAPRNMSDAVRLGLSSRESYAIVRSAELTAALALAGVPAWRHVRLGMTDQTAAFALEQLVRRLEPLLCRVRIVVTHAFEGGHPDHDAAAFAVHAACALIARRGPCPQIIEMPFYRASNDGWALQSFVPREELAETIVVLSREEHELKRRMMAAHSSQRPSLSPFRLDRERFRVAPAYDFRELPNGGALLYERYQWGMNGALWRELAASACAKFGLMGAS
jgi:LmbE family N-acetylglucosaminyl deacetylase